MSQRQQPITLPDGSSMHVVETVQDVSPFVPGKTGPAAQLDIHPANGGETLDPARAMPTTRQKTGPRRPRLGFRCSPIRGASNGFYTGLQVNRDPGVWVVWTGCMMMCLALYVAFFLPHNGSGYGLRSTG